MPNVSVVRVTRRGIAAITVMTVALLSLGFGLNAYASGSTKVIAVHVPGNNGTLKIHQQGTPSGTKNTNPKVCVLTPQVSDFTAVYKPNSDFDVHVAYIGAKPLCHSVTGTVSFNAYGTDGPTFATSGMQVFVDHTYVTLSASKTSGDLKVAKPDCFHQTDAYFGSKRFDGTPGNGPVPHYPNVTTPDNLLAYRNGGTACHTTPPPTTTKPPVTTTTTPPVTTTTKPPVTTTTPPVTTTTKPPVTTTTKPPVTTTTTPPITTTTAPPPTTTKPPVVTTTTATTPPPVVSTTTATTPPPVVTTTTTTMPPPVVSPPVAAPPTVTLGNPLPVAGRAGLADTSRQLIAGVLAISIALAAFVTAFVLYRRRDNA